MFLYEKNKSFTKMPIIKKYKGLVAGDVIINFTFNKFLCENYKTDKITYIFNIFS